MSPTGIVDIRCRKDKLPEEVVCELSCVMEEQPTRRSQENQQKQLPTAGAIRRSRNEKGLQERVQVRQASL